MTEKRYTSKEIDKLHDRIAELEHRLRCCGAIVRDVLDQGGSVRDERIEPELRDIERLARGNKAITTVGRQLFDEVARPVPSDRSFGT